MAAAVAGSIDAIAFPDPVGNKLTMFCVLGNNAISTRNNCCYAAARDLAAHTAAHAVGPAGSGLALRHRAKQWMLNRASLPLASGHLARCTAPCIRRRQSVYASVGQGLHPGDAGSYLGLVH